MQIDKEVEEEKRVLPEKLRSYPMQLQLFGKQILLYRVPIDFRPSIDGLRYFITREIKQSPQEGIYLF